jgi:hypothetical protein
MNTPVTFSLLRALIAVLTVALFAVIILGLEHIGPLQTLGAGTDQLVTWLHRKTEVLAS